MIYIHYIYIYVHHISMNVITIHPNSSAFQWPVNSQLGYVAFPGCGTVVLQEGCDTDQTDSGWAQ